jgi:hypothetical protein
MSRHWLASVPIDYKKGERPWANTDDPGVQAVILTAIEQGLIWFVHLATECRMWSCARTTGTSPVPVGVVQFTAQVLEKVEGYNTNRRASPWQPIFVSIENPFPSGLFDVTAIAKPAQSLGLELVRYECCAWGATYRKCSQLRTNMRALAALGQRCKDLPEHTHEQLEGTVRIMGGPAVPAPGSTTKAHRPQAAGGPAPGSHTVSVWKTSLAAAYPPAFCRRFAQILKREAPPGALRPPGAPTLSAEWQRWLMTASGHQNYPLIELPTCPAAFQSGWEEAVGVWNHQTAQGRRGHPLTATHKKRPAAHKKSPAAHQERPAAAQGSTG